MSGAAHEPTASTSAVPLFPLQGVLLFPGLIQPLHIFEPRYRDMVTDVIDSAGEIVLGTVLEASETDMLGSPPVEPVAGLGRVEYYKRLEDGRYQILLRGISRVRIHEIPSERPYRQVEIREVQEIEPSETEADDLRPRLVEALNDLADRPLELPDEIGVGQLADFLLAQLSLTAERQHELYSERVVGVRARGVLAHHTDG